MYGYIYKVTVNNPDSSWHNHYYIGQKKASTVINSYYGSGTKISSYQKKYGSYGLQREILCTAQSKEELNRLEFEAIGDLWETDPLCMNTRSGGGQTGFHHSAEVRARISDTMKKLSSSPEARARLTSISRGRTMSEETKKKISQANKEAYKSNEVRAKISAANKGRNPLANLTPEQIKERYQKAAETHKRNLASGVTSTSKGARWYNNGEVSTLTNNPPEGFVLGRLPFTHRRKK